MGDPIYHQYSVELPGGYLIVQKDTGHPTRGEIAARLLADQIPDATLKCRGVWHDDWAPAGPPDEHIATVMRRMETTTPDQPAAVTALLAVAIGSGNEEETGNSRNPRRP